MLLTSDWRGWAEVPGVPGSAEAADRKNHECRSPDCRSGIFGAAREI